MQIAHPPSPTAGHGIDKSRLMEMRWQVVESDKLSQVPCLDSDMYFHMHWNHAYMQAR